ncbi:MAG TPA: hypothetical protein VEI73_02545 [Candidatus Acidoferrum sp.]|nr:hypothetical protein [Candidatus Acidoferrum sp.]
MILIPMIHDARRLEFFARPKSKNARVAALVFSFLILFSFNVASSRAGRPRQSQDPNSKPAPAPAAHPVAPAQTKPSSETAQEAAPLKKAVHEKKVITEEDLAKPGKPLKLSEGEDEESNSICDLSCEAELKAQMGVTKDRELEFRNQLTLARNEIGNDRAWNSMLDDAFRAASSYCDVQRQKAEILSKGDSSGYARYMVNDRFAKKQSDLTVQYRNYADLAKQHISVVQRFASFRATIMEYQWNDLTNRACPDFQLP